MIWVWGRNILSIKSTDGLIYNKTIFPQWHAGFVYFWRVTLVICTTGIWPRRCWKSLLGSAIACERAMAAPHVAADAARAELQDELGLHGGSWKSVRTSP